MLKRARPLLLIVLLTNSPLSAQTMMDADAFEAYSQGKTFYFGYGGTTYGAEEYLPNRRVRWSFLDGRCKEGNWYQEGELICFVYEDDPEPKCWSVFKNVDGLMVQLENGSNQTTLFEVEQNNEPMVCLGPEIGV